MGQRKDSFIRWTAVCPLFYVRTLQPECKNIKLKDIWNISY